MSGLWLESEENCWDPSKKLQDLHLTCWAESVSDQVHSFFNCITILCLYLFLTPNSRFVFCAVVSLNLGHIGHMKLVVGDCMDAYLCTWYPTRWQCNTLYLSVCHADVLNLGNGLQSGHGDRPFWTGVAFQTLLAMYEFSSPPLHHVVWRGILP